MWALSACRIFDIFHEVFGLTEVDPFLRSELQAELSLFRSRICATLQ